MRDRQPRAEVAVAPRAQHRLLGDKQSPFVAEQTEHATHRVGSAARQGARGVDAAHAYIPIAAAAESVSRQRRSSAPAAQVECVPLEIRSGSFILHTGPSATRRASNTRQ